MPVDKVEFREDWYKKFVSNTNEKNILVDKISSLLNGRKASSCLEIGLGISPYFAQRLSSKFQRYVIIEKRVINEKIPKKATLINADFENYDINQKFDVIVASHVIYYFNDKNNAVEKIFNLLKPNGIAFFVVNGKTADYGPLKLAFSKMIGCKYEFTYDTLLKLLTGKNYKEYTVPSSILFSDHESLFTTLKLSFDTYPEEYESLKSNIIAYLKKQIKGNKFIIDQKIIEVIKDRQVLAQCS